MSATFSKLFWVIFRGQFRSAKFSGRKFYGHIFSKFFRNTGNMTAPRKYTTWLLNFHGHYFRKLYECKLKIRWIFIFGTYFRTRLRQGFKSGSVGSLWILGFAWVWTLSHNSGTPYGSSDIQMDDPHFKSILNQTLN